MNDTELIVIIAVILAIGYGEWSALDAKLDEILKILKGEDDDDEHTDL